MYIHTYGAIVPTEKGLNPMQKWITQFIIQSLLFAVLISAFMVGAYVFGDAVHHLLAIVTNSFLILFCFAGLIYEASK